MQETKALLPKKIGCLFYGLAGFLFVFFWKTEADLAERGNLLWTGEYLAGVLALSLSVGTVLGVSLCLFLYALAEGKGKRCPEGRTPKPGRKGQERIEEKPTPEDPMPEGLTQEDPAPKGRRRGSTLREWGHRASVWLEGQSAGRVFGGAFLLIAISWIPSYLAYYPAICSYDTPIQMGQVMGDGMNDHHPLVHTLLLRGMVFLGRDWFGEVNAGIALYAAVQLLFLAAALAYGVAVLHRFRVRTLWQVLVLFYGMFYPFHWYMAVTVTKDTVFTGFVVWMTVSMCALLLEERRGRWVGCSDVLFFLGTVGVVLFRNNGKYALMVALFFLSLSLVRRQGRRRLLRIWGEMLAGLLTGSILLSAVFTLSGAEQGDRREMLSMPIQQLARTMLYHGGVGVLPEDDGTMEERDKALINDFLLDEGYRWYDADLADPVKRHTNTYVVRYRTKEFLETYFRLLGRYPGDFVNAALAVNAGYLSPGDRTHAHINEQDGLVGRGYVQTYWFEQDLTPRGFYKDSRWPELRSVLEDWADRNGYLDLPLLKYLFVPGSFLYLYLLLAGWRLLRREFRMLLPLAFVLGYYGTLFLGPTVQLRYLYPIMTILPFLALLHKNSAKG